MSPCPQLLCVLCACVAWAAALSPGFNDPMPFYTYPLLEILHPQNDMMLAATELQVEIEIREELLSGGLRRSRVCILMQPAFVPPDVTLDKAGSELDESCFDQSLNYTTFHVAGLVPGLSYAITVGLENGGNMVALSTRTFSVGSILLPGVHGRLSVADALEAGAQLHNAKDRVTAARIYRYVLEIFPDHAQAQHLLGLALYQDGELRRALPYLYHAVQSNESEENFHNSLGICLKSLGRVDEAIQHYRRALELNPMQVQAAVNLGDAMQSQGKWEDALQEYSKVAKAPMSLLDSQLEPGKSENVAKDATGRMCELIRVTDGWYHADRCLNEALERWPDEPLFHNDRGNLLANAGQFETALDEYQRSAGLGLLAGKLNLAQTLEALGEMQQSIDLYDRIGPRRLRVGFVSRYMFNPAVGLYMSELLPQFDRNKYEIIVFAIGQSKSMKVVKQIEAITETLGMDKTTYFLSLARLAPVQAVWWGNADTSGVPTVDYYLASEHEHNSVSSHYSEIVYRFKGMGIYHKLPDLPKKSIRKDQVRRAIEERFDIPSDFHFYLAIEVRALILEKDKKAHIFLLSTSSRKIWKGQLQSRMESAGVDPNRLHFLTDVDQKQESMLMRAADAVVASLHLTRPRASLQAFAAAVPVVTFPNELWASRITYAFYQQMGINDLIATSLEEYVSLAVKLATDAVFHEKMAQLIKQNRSKLSEDQQAVREWEKFFDFAGRQVFPSGEKQQGFSTIEWGPIEGLDGTVDWSQVEGVDEIEEVEWNPVEE
uniref:protein O-GlcNAc transferase n=1 Tax=Phytophthora ramorum TaxID=164328 RepID=H3GFD3_PHYRM